MLSTSFPKVCLESRDWLAGAFATDSVIASVEQSKRTILLVSEHYFQSPWLEYQFQVAHLQVSSPIIILDTATWGGQNACLGA